MEHSKLTFVGLLALTSAASDVFAQGPRFPRWVARHFLRLAARRVSQWAAPQLPQRAAAYRVPRRAAEPAP